MKTMSDADTMGTLIDEARKQLDEHRAWLAAEIRKVEFGDPALDSTREPLALQVGMIQLRAARVLGTTDAPHRATLSVVYDYPDELFMFLTSDLAPAHLRATVEGGHVVSPEQPAFTVERERP